MEQAEQHFDLIPVAPIELSYLYNQLLFLIKTMRHPIFLCHFLLISRLSFAQLEPGVRKAISLQEPTTVSSEEHRESILPASSHPTEAQFAIAEQRYKQKE